MIAPLAYPIPPKLYGGIELVVYYLVEGLIKKGHEVVLFACKGSKTSAKFYGKWNKQLYGGSLDYQNLIYCLARVNEIVDMSGDFDVIHNHDGFLAMSQSKYLKCPLVTTWHIPIGHSVKKDFARRVLVKKNNLISISYAQRKGFPGANYIANVYNGTVDMDKYQLGRGGDYLVWIGRFDDYKGAKEAIAVAEATGLSIYLAGKMETKDQINYFNEFIKPKIDNKKVIFLGEIGINEKNKILGGARAFLMPIFLDEPFGLVMIEAMACGTPVIAFNRGSVSEIVDDGTTGFVVKGGDLEAMAKAVRRADSISRKACRERVKKCFSIEQMVNDYEAIYKKLIKK
jgi:glycosyltransferase involved in cell wall biosynthesis